jgi:hypothetical protein
MTVYGSLRWLSGLSRRLCCTRRRITEICGLHEDTITKAMKALNEAGWVEVNYGRHRKRTWYRLSFPKIEFFPVAEKLGGSAGDRSRKKRPQQRQSCGRKNRLHSLEGVGASFGPAPTTDCGAERTPACDSSPAREIIGNNGPVIPIADILGIRHEKPGPD